MPESPRPTEPSPRHHATPRGSGRAELQAIVALAALKEGGLELLRRAPLEAAAVLLGVAPRVIERVRDALEEPARLREAEGLVQAIRSVRQAVPVAPPAPPTPRDEAQLLEAARARTDGLAVLLDAQPEVAAVSFGVHPDLVHGARRVASRRAGPPRN